MGMRRYAALLRGINVAGHRRVAMAELRELLESLGYRRVVTYLQSGQVAFDAEERPDDVIAARISQALSGKSRSAVDVIVRDHAYLDAVVSHCPFPADEYAPKQIHVIYCSARPDSARLDQVAADAFLPDRFAVGDRVIYCLLPSGIGRSKLAAQLVQPRVLGASIVATVRNWNTAKKLAAMTDEV
ncbi:DUF1697 domain-containing protein [Bifidobacterium sp.]|jgi:uncharacterized protein (DUF1697 family)|uniref:DUF1697 domain-containing protein n=1 Tax=Bifidobacterium sp. TaxID=41200 RepID=UPI0025B7C45D|nr:DUF1697 domain-containing protein [Bifidobacterium sp.]MCH4209394.1 DUF1697 domain-containing protein [Bifidobacterium sp.]MCI1224973.1 DUF1697 domain-containing protein [Bifidobacterium sp.]